MTGNNAIAGVIRARVAEMRKEADAGQAIGATALALGGGLGGSAVTGDDQSVLKRIGKGVTGTAVSALGYKAMTDPKWRAGINSGVDKAMSYIRGLVGAKKAAESENVAYLAGFCKAAEAMGVDPDALYKRAIALGDIAWLGSSALGAIRSGARAVGGAARRAGSRYAELMRGGSEPVRGAFKMTRGDLQSFDKLKGYFGNYIGALRGKFGPEAASELRKVLGARLGTAGVGTAGLYGAGKAMSGGSSGQAQQMPG